MIPLPLLDRAGSGLGVTSHHMGERSWLVYEVIKLDNLEKALTADPDDDLTSGPHKLRWLRMPEEEESAANPNKETEA